MLSSLELYEKLKPKLGEEESRDLLEYVEEFAERRAATKEDVLKFQTLLKEDITTVRTELKEEISTLKVELRQDIAAFRTELEIKISDTKAEIIKWMFIFWIVQIAVIIGIIKFLLPR